MRWGEAVGGWGWELGELEKMAEKGERWTADWERQILDLKPIGDGE
jgi:hypothetical protein